MASGISRGEACVVVRYVNVIGIGASEAAVLSEPALQALSESAWVVGSPRQLESVRALLGTQRCKRLPTLSELGRWLESDRTLADRTLADRTLESETVTLLASGDPLFYGIGRWVGKRIPADRLRYYPAVSSMQVACHALGLALQDVDVVSLHGRPVETLRTHLRKNRVLLILTDKESHPQRLAKECQLAGFEASKITVCEALGYPQQQIRHFCVNDLLESALTFDPLHISVLHVAGIGGRYPESPGIPDADFCSDAMLTKREVRLALLSLLQVGQGDTVWDIGAGCGSVSVELALWSPRSSVYAVEKNRERLAFLQENRKRFGVVSNLHSVEGRAPEALAELPPPTRIFIGGSDGALPALLQRAWEVLPEQGILVVSAVTERTRAQLIEFMQERLLCEQGAAPSVEHETFQVAVSRGSTLGGQLIYRPNLPVTLFRWKKVGGAE